MVGDIDDRRRGQRRRQLLRPPDGREGPGRRVGRRGDACRQESRRRTAGRRARRSSTTPNAQTAVLRNQVIGTQLTDITRAPTRLFESEMGNMVADAMRAKYPGVDAAYTNSGGLRRISSAHLPPPARRRARSRGGRCSQCCRSATGRSSRRSPARNSSRRSSNGFAPACDPSFAGGTGRFPQISGLRVTYTCNGMTPVVTGMWKTPEGIDWSADADRSGRPGALRHQRLHVHRR